MPKAAPKHKPMPHLARVHRILQPDENYGKGRGGRPWRRKRDEVMKRDAFLCQKCKADGRLTLGTQVDHRVPKAEGGTDDLGNLQLMCSRCHDEKSKAEASRGRNGRGSWNRKHPGGVPRT